MNRKALCEEHKYHSLPGDLDFGRTIEFTVTRRGDFIQPLPDYFFSDFKCPVCRDRAKKEAEYSGVYPIYISLPTLKDLIR